MRYVLRRVGFYLIAAWIAITLNFFLPRLIPGNPVELLLSKMSDVGTPPPGEAAALAKMLGLSSGNLLSQYWQYLDSLAHLNLGISVTEFPEPVTTIIWQTLPWTVILVGTATVISFVVGNGLGALAAWKRGSWLDSLVPATTFLTAIPYFWLALLMLYLFAQVLPIWPLNGGYAATDTIGFTWPFIQTAVEHSFLPAVTIVLASLGGWLLGMRNLTVSTLSEDYILAAEAKGLSQRRVLLGYAMRNAMMPQITAFATSLSAVVSGSIVMEYVFSYPGIGYQLLEAVQNDDYALAQGIFLVITFAVLITNLIVDLLGGVLDPRTRQAR